MNNTTAIAIPAKLTNTVEPPLKKGELIKALAIRKHAQLVKERAETKEIYEKERAAIRAEIQKIAECFDVSKCFVVVNEPYVRADNGKQSVQAPEASITFDVDLPSDLKKRIIANDARRHIVRFEEVPSLSEIERQLRAELNGQPSDRVGTILNDEASVKVLDQMLAKIDRRAETKQLAAGAVTV
jgi:hypothetical protein